MDSLTEDDIGVCRLAFGFKTMLYILSGIGLFLFGWLPNSYLQVTILFSLTASACIFCALFDFIQYLKNKYIIGEIPRQSLESGSGKN